MAFLQLELLAVWQHSALRCDLCFASKNTKNDAFAAVHCVAKRFR
jgi:hypothetical protein